jgi:phosphonate ABC transporter permease subunit PhnE
MKQKPSLRKSIVTGIAVIIGIVVYAYGFTVTRVDFAETRSEDRRASLTRILRALTHPDLFEIEYQVTDLDFPFYISCPEDGVEYPDILEDGAYITVNVPCADPEDTVVVEGFNLQARSSGPINFIAYNPDFEEGITIQLGSFKVDENGHFEEEVELPNRRSVEQAQTIRATGRVRVGISDVSDEVKITWDKIVETVFLALLATTFGTLISIPISFFAARNLMSDVKSPLSSIALSLIGWPLGILAGIFSTSFVLNQMASIAKSTNILVELLAAGLGAAFVYLLLRQQLRKETEVANWSAKIIRLLMSVVMILLIVASLFFLGEILLQIGDSLVEPLGWFGFFGNFIYILGDLITMLISAIGALSIGAVVGGLLGQIGQTISDKVEAKLAKTINMVISPIAFGLIAVLIMRGIDWFYQFENTKIITLYPAIVGAVIGLIMAIIFAADQALPTGSVIYFIARTIMNGTRSVEPLIMAIVFVAWVGLGPFAGSLALGLHTIAALSKLYSEQVESILTGPLEAVKATGANRLQTIVFAVVPQIIPPYISFTMYRWDINVRMSTIIGFVGGGGIGFVLQQNINLLNYRAAAVNILAIAIVVASMDYISSSLRERFV